jgi:23S rRNA (uracil1939-C5)-methyltransferase
MTERLTIARIGHRGDGIADTPQGPVYVPYALPGETVEVEAVSGHPDRRHLLAIVTPSPDRIAPICPHFGICGGCAIQNWREDLYRNWKRDLLVTALRDAGLDCDIGEMIDAHGEGRRRAVFHARRDAHDIISVGFAALRAHAIVPIDHCPVLAPGLDGAINAAWRIAEALKPQDKPLDIHVTASEAGLDIDVRGSGPLDAKITQTLASLAQPGRIARLTRHGEMVTQIAAPTIAVGRARVPLPPGAFLQATQSGQKNRRSVLRHRPLRAAACGTRARHRDRQRGESGCRTKTRSRSNARPETRRDDHPRPVSPPASGHRIERFRYNRIRSAASGRADAGDRNRPQQGCECDRGVLQPVHLRA